ncbi:MAG: hypothetical protein ACRDY3_14270 [Acidimicrobiales bacterium]
MSALGCGLPAAGELPGADSMSDLLTIEVAEERSAIRSRRSDVGQHAVADVPGRTGGHMERGA